MEEKLVQDLINNLIKRFEQFLVTRVKKHIFWNININITEDKNVVIQMKDQFLKAIEEFG